MKRCRNIYSGGSAQPVLSRAGACFTKCSAAGVVGRSKNAPQVDDGRHDRCNYERVTQYVLLSDALVVGLIPRRQTLGYYEFNASEEGPATNPAFAKRHTNIELKLGTRHPNTTRDTDQYFHLLNRGRSSSRSDPVQTPAPSSPAAASPRYGTIGLK